MRRRGNARCCSRSYRSKLSWVRRGELGRLRTSRSTGRAIRSWASACSRGYYANELLLRLMARGDPNAEIFSCYSRCLAQLGEASSLALTLRVFELELLQALGYGLELEGESTTGEPLRAELRCVYELERGFRRAEPQDSDEDVYPGRDLLALRDLTLDDDASLRTAQRLLGRALRAHLGERPLQSRLVLQDIVSRGL